MFKRRRNEKSVLVNHLHVTSGGEIFHTEDYLVTLEEIKAQPDPGNSFSLTREDATNQIISSIAMENLALSHILNAEGEKIQYVLRDFSQEGGRNATIDDVLATNDSVRTMLRTVANYQMLLYNKLFSAINL